MQLYEPKEKTAAIDWRCDTPDWNFKIINIDNQNLGLYRIKENKKECRLIKVSRDINELHYCAYDLQLMSERFKK